MTVPQERALTAHEGLFDGRVVIVTGAARGLGRDYARWFAQDGASVVVADLNGDGARATAQDITDEGRTALGLAVDITDPAAVDALVGTVVDQFGKIDILINNAALWGDYKRGGLLDVDIDYWNVVLAVNLTGALVCAKAVAPIMQAHGWGRIVNVSSIGAYMPAAGAYGVTKLALHQLTYSLAHELGPSGVTVNDLAPGSIANEATRGQVPEAVLEHLKNQTALKRLGDSHDMYGALRWLCSDDASWFTGQVLSPNGGAVARF